jgi:two-component system, cell cycle sensor histidine kinase and response regulator CckA
MASVLIVDDDPDVLDALFAVIASAGHVIERAGSGLAALDVIEGKRIDLLLTDVLMPGLHGFNLARMGRLRMPELRVLYISGFMELETIVQDEGPRLGKLLSKPIAPAELRREIAEALAAPPAP